jgi:benzoate membrane transport protein
VAQIASYAGALTVPQTQIDGASRALNSQNLTIGLTAAAFYAFSSTPVLFAAAAEMGLTQRQSVSWYVAVFLTATITSLALSLRFRMPIPVGWSLPGLVFLTASATGHSYPEMMGGVIVAGLGIVLLGAAGIADKLVHWMPMPVVMGVFAGSILKYVTAIFDNLQRQPFIVGAAVAGYVAAVALRRSWLPPMALAFLLGTGAALVAGELRFGETKLAPPVLDPVRPEFAPGGVLGIAIPLMLMALAMGNVQGFGILRNEGFDPPIRLATITMGVATMVNATFGGHVATLQTNGTAIMAGKDAGPIDRRYVSTVIAAGFAGLLALFAGSLSSLIGLFPAGLMPALAGLAIFTSLSEGMRKATSPEFALSGVAALAISASSFAVVGIGAPFWGFAGGMAMAIVVERDALRRHLRVTDECRPQVRPTAPVQEGSAMARAS